MSSIELDWSVAPEWAQYAAMDIDGEWHWYQRNPVRNNNRYWDIAEDNSQYLCIDPTPLAVENWTESLFERPTNNNMFTETKTTTEKKSPFVFEEGGPVHPCTYGNIHDGISLRDYFAGQAITALVTGAECASVSNASIAKAAYSYADAMLETRTLKPE